MSTDILNDLLESVLLTQENTTAGRLFAGLVNTSSYEPERDTLATSLIAVLGQSRIPDCRQALESRTAGPAMSTPIVESSVKSESRPTFSRPNGSLYYARAWGEYWDVDVLRRGHASGQFILLVGPPGTGKTAMAEAAFGDDLITVVITGETRVGELVGSFVPDGSGGYLWVDGPLLEAVRSGRPILLDEILLADSKVLSVIYPLMDGRGFLDVTENPDIGVVYASEGFYLVGAGNPDVPGARMSPALLSRFPVQVEVTTDFDLAIELGVDDMVVTLASALATRATGENPVLQWAPQFRELLAFKTVQEIWGRSFALNNLMKRVPRSDYIEVKALATNIFPSADLRAAKI